MALILCPECSREISDRVKSCPNCGYPLAEDADATQKVELTSVNVKIEEGKKKKILKVMTSMIIAILLIGTVFWIYNIQKTRKEAIAYSENLTSYGKDVNLFMTRTLSSATNAEELLNLTYKVWRNTIYKEYDTETDQYTLIDGEWVDDFNLALARLSLNYNIMEKVETIEKTQDRIKNSIKDLKDPPEEYIKTHELLLELHSAYQGITDLAISPKGSLQSFGENKNEKIEKFLEIYKRIEAQLPDF